MGFAAPAAMLFTAVTAGASIAGGIEERNARRMEAQQYERNAKLAQTAADQEDVLRREDLVRTMSAIKAVRGSRGLDPESPTGMAISDWTNRDAERAMNASRLNNLNNVQAYRTEAAVARSQGTSALLSGFLRAGSTVLESGLLDPKRKRAA